MTALHHPVRILIVGGGYVGMYTALGLQKKLSRGVADITVVDPQSNMTYQPFLPEAAAGSVEPRHVVVPLRKVLRRCHVITGAVTGIIHANKQATIQPQKGDEYAVSYDLLVVCPGSISRILPIPGLAERGIGFKTIGEAIYLRNHVLSRLDLAASTNDQAQRRRSLSFLFVGGGYAGVEALAELQDMARYALRYIRGIDEREMRWMLVEAASRIMPEVSVRLSSYTVDRLVERNIDVRLNTMLQSATDGHIVLSDGDEFDVETLVWTAGVKANPVLESTDLPRDDKGRLPCAANLTVKGVTGVFAAGDCAAVPISPRTTRTRSADPAPSTPSGRPRCSPLTLLPGCAAAPFGTTGTSMWARLPRSACTAVLRSCTGSRSGDRSPGSCTAPTTSRGCRR